MVDQLTEEEVTEFKEAFALFDKDGDGTIPTNELDAIMKQLGQSLAEEELQIMIEKADPDGTGYLDFTQFLDMMANIMKNTSEEDELREAFKIFDKEGTGYISMSELKHFLMNMGDRLTEEEMVEMIREVEINDDGEFDYEKLVILLTTK